MKRLAQGSLRQFITNSNALSNTGLDQVANSNSASGTTAIDPPAGQETSIFMIPTTALTNGVAVINLRSKLSITDSSTAIDGRALVPLDVQPEAMGTGFAWWDSRYYATELLAILLLIFLTM